MGREEVECAPWSRSPTIVAGTWAVSVRENSVSRRSFPAEAGLLRQIAWRSIFANAQEDRSVCVTEGFLLNEGAQCTRLH
jgi:hypothetical protein